jgi:hypothetical protein
MIERISLGEAKLRSLAVSSDVARKIATEQRSELANGLRG